PASASSQGPAFGAPPPPAAPARAPQGKASDDDDERSIRREATPSAAAPGAPPPARRRGGLLDTLRDFFGSNEEEEEKAPAREAAAATPAARGEARMPSGRTLRGRIALQRGNELVVEVFADGSDLEWAPGATVRVTFADGQVVVAAIDARRTTKKGKVAA